MAAKKALCHYVGKLKEIQSGDRMLGRPLPQLGTIASSATPAINVGTVDYFSVTALAVAITGFVISGTPVDGQRLHISIKDNGTARAITWGTSFEASTITLPITTVINARLDCEFIWNTVTSKFRIMWKA